jgi:hypothetical protein
MHYAISCNPFRFVPGRAARLLGGGLGLCLACAVLAADRVLEIYPLGQTEAELAAEVIRPLLAPEDQLIVDAKGSRILIRAEPATQEQVAGVIRQLAVPVQNVRIDVEFAEQGQSRDAGLGVGGGGRVTWPASGGEASGTVRVGVTGGARTDSIQRRTVQSLLVASGREASLRVGESVPQIDWFMEYGRHHGVWVGQVVWQEVGSILVVQPTVIGSGPDIRIRIIPELSGRVDGESRRVRFASAATEVTVRAGQTVSLGGMQKDESFYSRFLFGFSRGGETRALEITLTPSLLGPGGVREAPSP